MRDRPPDAVLLDIKMPEMDGLEALKPLRERGYEMPVLMICGHGDVPTAVEATRRGAFDFFEKPLQRERVLLSLRNAVEAWRLRKDARQEAAARRGAGRADRHRRRRCAACARRSSAPRRRRRRC